ncbi:MAG: ABC transporter permease [Nitrospirae bacterium]|nr:MAG: ABC transporter permease [Nitrospirota bacterium]
MRGRRVWLLSVSLADLLFLYLPIGVLILFSFNASRLSATWQGFTFQWYRALAADEALMASLQNSLLVASVSTMIATVLGMSAAVSLERFQFRRQQVVEGALLLPLVMPEVMMGVALMLFFVTIKLPLSLVTVTLGHAAFNLPVVMVMVRARLRKLDPGLEEAARDLGATPWQAFQRVTLPLLMPAMIGAALMAFTISFDDFIVTFFTAGPGSTTLPLRVYSMVRSGVSPVINALSAMLVAISIALITLALTLQGGFQTHRGFK